MEIESNEIFEFVPYLLNLNYFPNLFNPFFVSKNIESKNIAQNKIQRPFLGKIVYCRCYVRNQLNQPLTK